MPNETQRVPVERESERGAGLLERPWEPFVSLRDEIDRVFEDFSADWALSPFRRRRGRRGALARLAPMRWGALVPPLDVVDKENELEIRAELPGMSEDDIQVRLSNGSLTIRGEKKEVREEGEEAGDYYVSERRFGAFQRTIPVPEGIDRDKIEAKFARGVLTVHLPKTTEAQQQIRKIEVKGS